MRHDNQGAWLLVLPALAPLIAVILIPLAVLANASVLATAAGGGMVWSGARWYEAVLHSENFWFAVGRNLAFSATALTLEIPLGVGLALTLPKKGWGASICLAVLATPLVMPWSVVGEIWRIFGRSDVGLLGAILSKLGVVFDVANDPVAAWIALMVMDVWHWTSLVALLASLGLAAIPTTHIEAARIDGASGWSVFWEVQLPKISGVLSIAFLLRLIDSLSIFAEPQVVTGGGPDGATRLLSQTLLELAHNPENRGRAAAMSLLYALTIAVLSWPLFLSLMQNRIVPTISAKARGAS